MSVHRKWSQIKHKKSATDAKKGAEFGKFARLISLESMRAHGNASAPELRRVIERARGINMPSSNIERALKKGLEKDAALLEEVMYEAYGPGGSALIIEGLTDNKNRTAGEVRHTISELCGTFAGQGAALWAFAKKEGGWIPKETLLLGEEDRKKLALLVEKLKESDDIQGVFTNAS